MLAVLEDQPELLSRKELEKLEIINGKAPLRIRKLVCRAIGTGKS